ncbi:discoidin domain-containing protein [Orbus sturtevantii]|uniref:discoidin domain-containing protein n=1 Tax=Orbus sturtevantii TaxID=3074109 RepID=UPI00370D43DB
MKLYRAIFIVSVLGLSVSAYAVDVKTVSASSYDQKSNHTPANLIDGNTSTRWAASGKNNWVLFEFKQEEKIDNIAINSFKSKERLLSFSISYSLDGNQWVDIPGKYQTTAIENKLAEKFVFSHPITAKYIRLNTFGTNYNNWSAINDVDFNSTSLLPTQKVIL